MSESEGRFSQKVPPNPPNTKVPQGGKRPAIVLEFGSVNQAVDWINQRPQLWFASDDSKAKAVGDSDSIWRGTATFDEALSQAQFGWREGAEKIVRFYDTINIKTKKSSPYWGFDVAGEIPDIPRFIAGDPEHMKSRSPVDRRKKDVLRVVVPINYEFTASHSLRAARGAALLDYLLTAQELKFEVELTVLSVSTPNYFMPGDDKYGPDVAVKIKIKDANDSLNLMRLAFWVMSNAAQRRIVFSIKERLDIAGWYRYSETDTQLPAYGRQVKDQERLLHYVSSDEALVLFPEDVTDARELSRLKEIIRKP